MHGHAGGGAELQTSSVAQTMKQNGTQLDRGMIHRSINQASRHRGTRKGSNGFSSTKLLHNAWASLAAFSTSRLDIVLL